ncbi:MAG TPA: F0F1 ATP synthase subunit delta [Candidatus Azoamicus sp.]
MSENITIARPYAKAIFSIAKSGDMLNEWDKVLSYLSIMMTDEVVVYFIKNKTISHELKSKLIIEFIDFQDTFNKDIQIFCINFINSLSYYGRLLYIKDIYSLYKNYVNIELGRVEAIVKVASSINNVQKEEIINCLSSKFNKKISALFEVDESLFGGFWVKTGDFVLDASIVGNLNSLRTKIMI